MLRYFRLAIFLVLTLCFACDAQWHYVRWVTDGDSIVLENGQRVRYLGINAPEIAHDQQPGEPFGEEALHYNIYLVKHKQVRIETDIEPYDRYGRLLGYVFLKDGTFVNLKMVKAGYAHVLFLNPHLKYAKKLLAAQRQAMKNKRNIWQVLLKETCDYYVGNTHSHKFHRPVCKYGQRILPTQRILFKKKWDAFYKGYSPCRKCRP